MVVTGLVAGQAELVVISVDSYCVFRSEGRFVINLLKSINICELKDFAHNDYVEQEKTLSPSFLSTAHKQTIII